MALLQESAQIFHFFKWVVSWQYGYPFPVQGCPHNPGATSCAVSHSRHHSSTFPCCVIRFLSHMGSSAHMLLTFRVDKRLSHRLPPPFVAIRLLCVASLLLHSYTPHETPVWCWGESCEKGKSKTRSCWVSCPLGLHPLSLLGFAALSRQKAACSKWMSHVDTPHPEPCTLFASWQGRMLLSHREVSFSEAPKQPPGSLIKGDVWSDGFCFFKKRKNSYKIHCGDNRRNLKISSVLDKVFDRKKDWGRGERGRNGLETAKKKLLWVTAVFCVLIGVTGPDLLYCPL